MLSEPSLRKILQKFLHSLILLLSIHMILSLACHCVESLDIPWLNFIWGASAPQAPPPPQPDIAIVAFGSAFSSNSYDS